MSGADGRIGIGLMSKPPRPGLSKTRLAATIGAEPAARLAGAFLRDVAETVAAACQDPLVAGFAFYRPAGAEDEVRSLTGPDFPLVLQQGDDLGAIMLHALSTMLETCPGGALLIGSDIPTLPAAVLAEAVASLREPGERAVFGPSEDGGYYLVGIKSRTQAPLFAPMAWSTPDVMATTRRRAEAEGIAILEVATWYDVDDAEGYARLRRDLAAHPGIARHTRAVCDSLDDARFTAT